MFLNMVLKILYNGNQLFLNISRAPQFEKHCIKLFPMNFGIREIIKYKNVHDIDPKYNYLKRCFVLNMATTITTQFFENKINIHNL